MKSRIPFRIIKGYSVQTDTELCPISAIMWVCFQSVPSPIISETLLMHLCVLSSFPAQLSHNWGKSLHQPCFEMGDDVHQTIKVCFALVLFLGFYFSKRLIYMYSFPKIILFFTFQQQSKKSSQDLPETEIKPFLKRDAGLVIRALYLWVPVFHICL